MIGPASLDVRTTPIAMWGVQLSPPTCHCRGISLTAVVIVLGARRPPTIAATWPVPACSTGPATSSALPRCMRFLIPARLRRRFSGTLASGKGRANASEVLGDASAHLTSLASAFWGLSRLPRHYIRVPGRTKPLAYKGTRGNWRRAQRVITGTRNPLGLLGRGAAKNIKVYAGMRHKQDAAGQTRK